MNLMHKRFLFDSLALAIGDLVIGVAFEVGKERGVENRIDRIHVDRAKMDIRQISSQLHMYRLDTGAYPSAEAGSDERPEILNRTDPWGNRYRYAIPGRAGEFDIYTLGADGEAGGTGINADISNWAL
jgi:general secretion pathway protein G